MQGGAVRQRNAILRCSMNGPSVTLWGLSLTCFLSFIIWEGKYRLPLFGATCRFNLGNARRPIGPISLWLLWWNVFCLFVCMFDCFFLMFFVFVLIVLSFLFFVLFCLFVCFLCLFCLFVFYYYFVLFVCFSYVFVLFVCLFVCLCVCLKLWLRLMAQEHVILPYATRQYCPVPLIMLKNILS